MPAELLTTLSTLSGSLITGLLAVNIFFVREFMKRMEKSIDSLAMSINQHGDKLTEVDKNFTGKISRLEEKFAEIDWIRKRSPRP